MVRVLGRIPFAKINELITDLITDVTNKLRSEDSSEAKYRFHRDDEEADLETHVATHSCKLEATVPKSSVLDNDVAELHGSRISQVKVDTMRVDERKIFATTVEMPQAQHVDKIVETPVVLQHQALTIQTEQKTPEVPHTQYLDQVIELRLLSAAH